MDFSKAVGSRKSTWHNLASNDDLTSFPHLLFIFFLDNASSDKQQSKQQPDAEVNMAQFQNNTESLMYLQECINDLQDCSIKSTILDQFMLALFGYQLVFRPYSFDRNFGFWLPLFNFRKMVFVIPVFDLNFFWLPPTQNRFYGLQLEQLQKERQQQMAQQNAIPSISSNSIWSTTGSEYSSGINSDRDSSSPTSSMRSSSPDLKVFWPQQQAAQAQPSKADVYQAYQQQMHQIQQLKMQQQQLLQQKAFNQQQQQPVGAKPTRFVSQQSIQIGSKQKVGKYVPPGKAKQMQQNKQTTNTTNQEKQKQGPYNKVLIVGLSAEYRSLNGVLSKYPFSTPAKLD